MRLLVKTDLQVLQVGHEQVYLADHGLDVFDRVVADVQRDYSCEFTSQVVRAAQLLDEALTHKNFD